MSAYAIGHISVIDEAKWAEYRSKVGATLAPWGGELLFRGQVSQILAGDHQHKDTVAIRFPDRQSLNNWFNSPAYQALITIREAAAKVDLIAYDGEA